jgi:hypothetical protein
LNSLASESESLTDTIEAETEKQATSFGKIGSAIKSAFDPFTEIGGLFKRGMVATEILPEELVNQARERVDEIQAIMDDFYAATLPEKENLDRLWREEEDRLQKMGIGHEEINKARFTHYQEYNNRIEEEARDLVERMIELSATNRDAESKHLEEIANKAESVRNDEQSLAERYYSWLSGILEKAKKEAIAVAMAEERKRKSVLASLTRAEMQYYDYISGRTVEYADLNSRALEDVQDAWDDASFGIRSSIDKMVFESSNSVTNWKNVFTDAVGDVKSVTADLFESIFSREDEKAAKKRQDSIDKYTTGIDKLSEMQARGARKVSLYTVGIKEFGDTSRSVVDQIGLLREEIEELNKEADDPNRWERFFSALKEAAIRNLAELVADKSFQLFADFLKWGMGGQRPTWQNFMGIPDQGAPRPPPGTSGGDITLPAFTSHPIDVQPPAEPSGEAGGAGGGARSNARSEMDEKDNRWPAIASIAAAFTPLGVALSVEGLIIAGKEWWHQKKVDEFNEAVESSSIKNQENVDILRAWMDGFFAENNRMPMPGEVQTKWDSLQSQNFPDPSGFLREPKIVELAAGGVFNKPTRAIIGERGSEAVIPLKSGKVPVEIQERHTDIDVSMGSNIINQLEQMFQAIKLGMGVQGDRIPFIEPGANILTPVPMLATGGVFNKPTRAIIGERGSEAVIPLKSGKVPVEIQEQHTDIGGVDSGIVNKLERMFQTMKPESEVREGVGLPIDPSSGILRSIPAFAAGGIVTQPTIAMIGERGPEAVVPLQSASGGMVGGFSIGTLNITPVFPGADIRSMDQNEFNAEVKYKMLGAIRDLVGSGDLNEVVVR